MEEGRCGAYEKTAAVYDFAIDDSCSGELGSGDERVENRAVLVGEKADGKGIVAAEGLVATEYMLDVLYGVRTKNLEMDDEAKELRDLDEEEGGFKNVADGVEDDGERRSGGRVRMAFCNVDCCVWNKDKCFKKARIKLRGKRNVL